MKTRSPKSLLPALSCVTAACLALAGCGGSNSKSTASPDAPRGIYTSTNDCADDRKMSFDICAAAVRLAVEEHNKNATTYPSQRACEATEGVGKCERTVEQSYRPRLLAFLVVGDKDHPSAEPLYYTKTVQDMPGFRNAAKTAYLESDLTLTFSKQAIATYQAHGREEKKGRF